MTQCERILRHLENNGPIDADTAKERYGVARLASRICDIERMGYGIRRETKYGRNRFGEKCHWTEYSLEEV